MEEAMAPTDVLFLSPLFDCCIIAVIGLKTFIDPDVTKKGLQETMLQHPRFTSVVAKDDGQKMNWRQTQVNLDNHIIVPNLNQDLDSPDLFVENYILDLTRNPIDKSKSLWELHLLNVKTSNATSTMIFKFHHSLGDGPSLISLLLASSRKMSDPSALPTFPKKAKTSQTTSGGLFFTVWSTFMLILNTLVDIIVFIATLFFLKDTKTPLKGGHGVAGNPKRLVHLTISLDDLRMVKKAMNVTINDVALGVTQAALSRYLSRKLENESLNEEVNKRTNRSLSRIRLRAVVMFSTRPTTSIESLADMMEKSSKVKWGNSFGYVLLPFNILLKSNPLHYVHQAKDTIDRKKHSLEALGTYLCSAAAIKLLGIETGGNIAHRIMSNTTFTFSNVVGPEEEISLFGYPVAYIAPSVYGHPHACTVHFQSYADKMTIVLAVDQSVIPDPHELSNDFAESFELIKAAALKR